MAIKIEELVNCRACGGTDFEVKVILGDLYPSAFLEGAISTETERAPLVLVECKTCNLVQLKHTVELDSMYKQYWYRSGLNKSMVSDLKDVYLKSTKISGAVLHVDIGCNDGTLSKYFKDSGIVSIGFDPANNLKADAQKNCSIFVNDYFGKKSYYRALDALQDKRYVGRNPYYRKVDIITAIAMFYDLPDPNQFMRDINSILHEDGIFVVQLTDLYSMLKINAFDNICHEHLEYYTLNWLVKFFEEHGLTIFDAEYNKVNGGSLRIYACHFGRRNPTIRLAYYMFREEMYFYLHSSWDDELLDNIISIGKKVKRVLLDAKNPYGLGASTKGNTLLQVLKINSTILNGIGEVNNEKFGLYTVGTSIPILSESDVMKRNPDICLVLPFHFEKTFLRNCDEYLNKGGKLLFPMPKPRIAYKENGKLKWKYL